SGNTWPGETRSSGRASRATAARMVVARSCAEIPVETPCRASIEMVNAVPSEERFSETIIGSWSLAMRSSVSVRQMRPGPYGAMKLMASGVTFSAAMVRSPSFSRSSSSTRITMLPARISSIARCTRSNRILSALLVLAQPLVHEFFHVFADDVDFQVDCVPRRLGAEAGLFDGVGDERNREGIPVHPVHRQGDPVDRD